MWQPGTVACIAEDARRDIRSDLDDALLARLTVRVRHDLTRAMPSLRVGPFVSEPGPLKKQRRRSYLIRAA